MTREEAINIISQMIKDEEGVLSENTVEAHKMAIEALEQEPCEDAISRKIITAFLSGLISDDTERKKALQYVNELPSVNPQLKTGQFAKWVATEIFDDDWEYNKEAFAEIACRKLAKLGIVRAKGDEWELVEPQGSEGKE